MALTIAQKLVLKAAIAAETDPAFVTARNVSDDSAMAAFYNAQATPAYIVWKSLISVGATGQAFVGTEWAGMTSANHTRLQTVAQYLAAGYDPSKADIRAMFNDIWSGAGGTATRAALLALWKRTATRGEKLFATGTGTDATPATLTFEGTISPQDVSDARGS